jgi:small ligand-binding sensory domain FIST
MLFVSHHHEDHFERIAAEVCDRIGTERLLGCSGESIVATGRELEETPAVSLWLAHLPGVNVTPMHLMFQQTPEGATVVGWPDDLPEPWPHGAAMLMLGEPFSFPADFLLERLNEDRPSVPVIGGMASGASGPGQNRLFLGRQSLSEGAVAVLLSGRLHIRAVVSQGCRPIGTPFVVTKAERNVIEQLGGKPSLARLKEIFETLPAREQRLVQQGLHVGRVVSEYQDHFEAGDFLVRNVVGADSDTGAIAIADYVRPGQTVQFHIRDEETASHDLRQLLSRVKSDQDFSPDGALLFTCNGRGTRMFSQPDHDAQSVKETLGDIPLAGFFAQGELGPVGGKNFVHGFTASLALFAGPSASAPSSV